MDYVNRLTEEYNKLHCAETPWNSLGTEKKFFNEFIESFFLPEQEGEHIKALYEAVSMDDAKVAVMDTTNMHNVYAEYFNGMETFAKEVCSYDAASDIAALEACTEMLNNAKRDDHAFIDSIHEHAEINPLTEKTQMERAEILNSIIDFRDTMNEQIKECNSFIQEGVEIPDGIKKESLKLLCESVSYYWLTSLKNMLGEYETLYNECVVAPNEMVKEEAFVLV